MTLDEIRASDKPTLTCAEVAGVLRADPQRLRVQARQRPATLGFPVIVVGTRTRIPREPFIAFLEGAGR